METRAKKLSEEWGNYIDKWSKLFDAPEEEDTDFDKMMSDLDDMKRESMKLFRESNEVLTEALETINRMDSRIEEIHSMLLTK